MKPPVMNIEANRRRRLVKLSTLTLALAVGLSVHVTASAQPAAEDIDAPAEAREIPVTIDNFARAASDIEFDKYVKLAGGINKFYHFREPTPVADGYFDKAPFKFEGTLKKLHFKNL